jgi:hypothetical protein
MRSDETLRRPLTAGAATIAAMLACSACSSKQVYADESSQSRQALVVSAPLEGWVEQQLVPDPLLSIVPSELGRSFAVFEEMCLVGAPSTLLQNDAEGGAVYPFVRNEGAWGSLAPITSPEVSAGHRFGDAIALSKDFAAISGRDDSGGPGKVWLYARAGNGFGVAFEPQTIDPVPDGSLFGSSLAFDDDELMIGAPIFPGATSGEGAVYIFGREPGSDSWHQTQLIRPWGDNVEVALFGSAIAVRNGKLVVGAPNENGTGAAYVLERREAGWVPVQRLAPASLSGARFGKAIALPARGLFVGAPFDNDGKGAVYPFTLDVTWSVGAQLVTEDGEENDGFGSALAASDRELFVSAPLAFADGVYSGRVQAFTLTDDHSELGWIVPTGVNDNVDFGRSLAIADSTLLIGAQEAALILSRSLGQACASSFDCMSGHCDDEVCCDRDCSGVCETCRRADQASKQGKDGRCGAAAAGIDPHDNCSSDGSACGTTGECDGSGACALASTQTVCSAAGCDSLVSVVSERHCDGNGQCLAQAPVKCRVGYICQTGSCLENCDVDSDCVPDFFCHDHACVKGATCVDNDDSVIDAEGNLNSCSPTRCRDGRCLIECELDTDCSDGFFCQAASCLKICEASSDCTEGSFCHDGMCLEGHTCIDDAKAVLNADGHIEKCSPNACRDGGCLERCDTSADCIDDFVCHPFRHQCVSEDDLASGMSSASPSCDCTSRTGQPFPWAPAALASLWAFHRQRRLARRSTQNRLDRKPLPD